MAVVVAVGHLKSGQVVSILVLALEAMEPHLRFQDRPLLTQVVVVVEFMQRHQ